MNESSPQKLDDGGDDLGPDVAVDIEEAVHEDIPEALELPLLGLRVEVLQAGNVEQQGPEKLDDGHSDRIGLQRRRRQQARLWRADGEVLTSLSKWTRSKLICLSTKWGE